MMNSADKNRLRRAYRPPAEVRLLMVGESPPCGPNFFYLCQGPVYDHTKTVFSRVFAQAQSKHGEEFLRWFQIAGIYVEDLCEDAVNDLRWKSPERKQAWEDGVAALALRIDELRPRAIFVFVKGITGYVVRAAREAVAKRQDIAGSTGSAIPISDGPMPNSRGDPTGSGYEHDLTCCLEQLNEQGVFAGVC